MLGQAWIQDCRLEMACLLYSFIRAHPYIIVIGLNSEMGWRMPICMIMSAESRVLMVNTVVCV